MPVSVLDNALSRIVLTHLRNADTGHESFRRHARVISTILAVEAARSLPETAIRVDTPLETTPGTMHGAGLVAVPVLRAGLGMLDSVLALLPHAEVGYLGLERDEKTAEAHTYYAKLPTLDGKTVWMLDPMLATGGSAAQAAVKLYEAGASDICLLCIVAAPEGVDLLARTHPDLKIITAAIDRELNDKKYILPGLGDFGDRLFGTE